MEDFNAADELANLKEKLLATREKFDAWNDDVIREIKDWFGQFDTNIQKHGTHLSELKENLNTLKQKNQVNQGAATKGLSSLEGARDYLQALQQHIKSTEIEKSEAEIVRKSREEILQSERDTLQATEESLKQHTAEMAKSAILTKDILGLSYRKAPGQKMQVVFCQIDPNNPEDPFVLSVAVVGGKYHVSDCQPDIADLDELVIKLNETNNLRSFLILVRRRFQKLV